VVERLNPAVVNIDTTTRGAARRACGGARRIRRTSSTGRSTSARRAGDCRAAAPGGFIIDADGSILTNHRRRSRGADHGEASDGRCAADRMDPDTDIALIKVDGQGGPLVGAARRFVDAADGEWSARSATRPATSTPSRSAWSASSAASCRHEPRQLHQTDAADQFRQQRRAADQLARRGHRHQRGDQLARDSIGFAVPSTAPAVAAAAARGRVSRATWGSGGATSTPTSMIAELNVDHGALAQDVTADHRPTAGMRPTT
jgi:S1-C subfamily serine protease